MLLILWEENPFANDVFSLSHQRLQTAAPAQSGSALEGQREKNWFTAMTLYGRNRAHRTITRSFVFSILSQAMTRQSSASHR